MQENYNICNVSYAYATLENDDFELFWGSKTDVETEVGPNRAKMAP